ncbi:restriction endonuclease subunit S [Nostoc sp. NZL]|nr:restriction endonuclease subunit S [Nostoc sp. NZL]
MQKLFSQQIRFKQSDGSPFPDWERKRLEELFSEFKSGYGITSDEITEHGTYPVFGGNGLRGYTEKFTHDGFYFLIGRQGALCGNIHRTYGKAYISEHAIACRANDTANTEWLAQRLDYYNLNKLSESSAQPGLSVNKLLRFKLFAPSKEEQEKMTGFLTTIDRKIETISRQIDQTEQFKKGLLQKIFV